MRIAKEITRELRLRPHNTFSTICLAPLPRLPSRSQFSRQFTFVGRQTENWAPHFCPVFGRKRLAESVFSDAAGDISEVPRERCCGVRGLFALSDKPFLILGPDRRATSWLARRRVLYQVTLNIGGKSIKTRPHILSLSPSPVGFLPFSVVPKVKP